MRLITRPITFVSSVVREPGDMKQQVRADDPRWPVRQYGFRHVVRDAQCRQSGAHCAAQIMVDPPFRQIDGGVIVTSTVGKRLTPKRRFARALSSS